MKNKLPWIAPQMEVKQFLLENILSVSDGDNIGDDKFNDDVGS